MSIETVSMAPAPLTREKIIDEGGIPAEIFDYVDKALEDPDTRQRITAMSFWFPCGWETSRELRISKEHSLWLFMQGPDGSKRGHIRIIDADGSKNAWTKPAFRGPLTLKSAPARYCKDQRTRLVGA